MRAEQLENMEIKVYDLKNYITKITDNKYQPHLWNKMAIVLTEKGNGIIADYEAIGYNFDSIEETRLFPIEQIEEGKSGIKIFPDAEIKLSINRIINEASFETMQGKDFFTKRNYNSRCQCNWNELLGAL